MKVDGIMLKRCTHESCTPRSMVIPPLEVRVYKVLRVKTLPAKVFINCLTEVPDRGCTDPIVMLGGRIHCTSIIKNHVFKMKGALTKARARTMLTIKNTVVISEQQQILPMHRTRPPFHGEMRSTYTVTITHSVYLGAQVALVAEAVIFQSPSGFASGSKKIRQ